MTSRLLLVGFVLLGACASAGGKGGAPSPSVDAIFEAHLEATGGRAAHAALQRRLMMGTLTVPAMGIEGTASIFQEAPARWAMNTRIEGVGSEVVATDGTQAWSVSTMTGRRLLEGKELAQRLHDARLAPELAWREHWTAGAVKGRAKVGDAECHEVALTTPWGDEQRLFFDVKTGLLVELRGVQHTQMGAVPAVQRLSDYREVDGVKLPFRVSVTAMGVEQVFVVATVHHPPSLPAELFVPPQL